MSLCFLPQLQDGLTALVYAACSNHIETIEVLLNAGADINAISHVRTLLSLSACSTGLLSLFEWL